MGKLSFLDNTNLQKIVFRKLSNIANSKGLTDSQWAKESNIEQGDLSKVINGKKGIVEEKFLRLLNTIGVSQKQLQEIIKESKKEELKIYYGEDIQDINVLDNLTLDDLAISLAKESGSTDKEVIEDIKKYAEYRISQGDTEFLKKLIRKK